MKKRTPVSVPDLHQLLEREFDRRKPRECDVCYLQAPFHVEPADAESPNWEVPLPLHCAAACRLYAEEVVAKLSGLFELDVSPQ
jgi:hypothetical protein